VDGFAIRFILAFVVGIGLTVFLCKKLNDKIYNADKFYVVIATVVITACLAIFCGIEW